MLAIQKYSEGKWWSIMIHHRIKRVVSWVLTHHLRKYQQAAGEKMISEMTENTEQDSS
jgi:hypothetical protein